MSELLTGNAVVGQSGGPTAVINQSLVGVIQAVGASNTMYRLKDIAEAEREVAAGRVTPAEELHRKWRRHS